MVSPHSEIRRALARARQDFGCGTAGSDVDVRSVASEIVEYLLHSGQFSYEPFWFKDGQAAYVLSYSNGQTLLMRAGQVLSQTGDIQSLRLFLLDVKNGLLSALEL